MKKFLILGIALLVCVAVLICFKALPLPLGNMSYICSTPETNISTVSFSGEEGEKLKFSLKSDVESGNLEITLHDSHGNTVYTLDEAKELVCYYVLDKSDDYTLSAEYSDFVGNFKVTVDTAD